MELAAVTPDAPWLPPGGRAEVWRSDRAPSPTGLARLLLRRGDGVFCVPRADGRLDLPTRTVPADDPDGSRTAAALARLVTESDEALEVVGFVRNVVRATAAGYDWPVPVAHFTVWTSPADPLVPGSWLPVSGRSLLSDRHWFPLL